MGFFNESRKSQRNMERFVLIFYSIYSFSLCMGGLYKGWKIWILGIMLTALVCSWAVFLSKYRNYRVRATLVTAMIQLTVILYAAHRDDLSNVIPTFMALTVLVAFYGIQELIWFCFASVFFVLFYHFVVTDTFQLESAEVLMNLFPQIGNIFCIGYVLYIWVKNRNEQAEQMYEIIDALMEAEQSKDDFLSNVSHEIRTPVNTICGISELALREHDLEKMREEIFDIRDAGHNLMSLVSDILDFSQLQQGKMNIEEEAYNIASTMNDIVNMAMARKGEKQVELIMDCALDIPSGLLGDEKKIRRVIMNLVDNAIKFTNEGGIILSVNTRKENYGVNLCITVKDTGIGMSEESLEKLFESFSQVDTKRNRQKGGVGLGLAISKELILKMGGTITVRSRLGKGSVFRVVIPQKVLNEKPIGQLENREKLNIATYFDMEQFDMMAIRDEYVNLIAHMVKQLQVRCHACRNLAELKRRESRDAFTHIFISLEEYMEDRAYFDELSKQIKVILVIERYNEKYISNSNLIRLYKPFYILPVVSILNGSGGFEGGKQMVRQGKFTAPDAHILVVDDNRMNIRVVEGLLKDYQIKVSYATSGKEALEMIENMSYDFVFMDHMMPEMDGVEVMHRIRDKVGHYYQKVPIVALTANAAPGNREMFLEEGFDDFLAKPVEISVLERVLKRNLPEEKLIFLKRKEKEGFQTEAEEKTEYEKDENDNRNVNLGGREFIIGDLDVKQGMLYCGEREQYLEILKTCCEEEEEISKKLEDLYKKQDWKNYTIKVHGLKSTMRSIGALPLSEMAKALEMAGKQKDTEFILKKHEEMLLEYHRVMKELSQSPLLYPEQPDRNFEESHSLDLPELEEDVFDKLLAELEDAMYSLNSEQMLTILSQMQEYQYCQTVLREKLAPVKKKIEMSDYMSAVDTVTKIREELKNGEKGGTAI